MEIKFECRKSLWFGIKTFLLSLIILGIGISAFFISDLWIFGLIIVFIGIIIPLVKFLELSSQRIIFYENKIIRTMGFFTRRQISIPITKIVAVTMNQPFLGRILNYGDVFIDVVGRWDANCIGVKKPIALKNYVEKVMDQANYSELNTVILEK